MTEFDLINPSETQQQLLETIPCPVKIIKTFERPDKQTVSSLRYRTEMHAGLEIKPGEGVLINLPAEIALGQLDSITLLHRKNQRYASENVEGWDPQGAYSRLLVHDQKANRWLTWPDPYKTGRDSLTRGDKFAEVRPPSNPESEVLYDWLAKVGEIHPDAIVAISVGEGTNAVVNFHGIDLDIHPETLGQASAEWIFSPGTKFVDFDKGIKEPDYGGGMQFYGKYPNSVPLNHPSSEHIPFPTNKEGGDYYLDARGRLHLKITKPIDFRRLEVAIGDTEHSNHLNKDGHYGRLGWAKLYAYVNHGGVEEQIMNHINIPPNGVLKGSPKEILSLKPGDEIIIEARNDAAYVMGARIQ